MLKAAPVSYIIEKVLEELRIEFSQVPLLEQTTLSGALAQITQRQGISLLSLQMNGMH